MKRCIRTLSPRANALFGYRAALRLFSLTQANIGTFENSERHALHTLRNLIIAQLLITRPDDIPLQKVAFIAALELSDIGVEKRRSETQKEKAAQSATFSAASCSVILASRSRHQDVDDRRVFLRVAYFLVTTLLRPRRHTLAYRSYMPTLHYPEIQREVENDVGLSEAELERQPLFEFISPKPYRAKFASNSKVALPESCWGRFEAWQQAALQGQEPDIDLYYKIALLPSQIWAQGPAAVSDAIERIEQGLGA
jgi:hypothetical protein